MYLERRISRTGLPLQRATGNGNDLRVWHGLGAVPLHTRDIHLVDLTEVHSTAAVSSEIARGANHAGGIAETAQRRRTVVHRGPSRRTGGLASFYPRCDPV